MAKDWGPLGGGRELFSSHWRLLHQSFNLPSPVLSRPTSDWTSYTVAWLETLPSYLLVSHCHSYQPLYIWAPVTSSWCPPTMVTYPLSHPHMSSWLIPEFFLPPPPTCFRVQQLENLVSMHNLGHEPPHIICVSCWVITYFPPLLETICILVPLLSFYLCIP